MSFSGSDCGFPANTKIIKSSLSLGLLFLFFWLLDKYRSPVFSIGTFYKKTKFTQTFVPTNLVTMVSFELSGHMRRTYGINFWIRIYYLSVKSRPRYLVDIEDELC